MRRASSGVSGWTSDRWTRGASTRRQTLRGIRPRCMATVRARESTRWACSTLAGARPEARSSAYIRSTCSGCSRSSRWWPILGTSWCATSWRYRCRVEGRTFGAAIVSSQCSSHGGDGHLSTGHRSHALVATSFELPNLAQHVVAAPTRDMAPVAAPVVG